MNLADHEKRNKKINIQGIEGMHISNVSALINQQGARLDMPSWEVDCLLSTCEEKNSHTKALSLLNRYAGLEDEISSSMVAMMASFEKLMSGIYSGNDQACKKGMIDFARHIVRYATFNLQWRSMQWCPRATFVPSMKFSDRKTVGSISELFRKNANTIFQALGVVDFDMRKMEDTRLALAIVLSPLLDEESITFYVRDDTGSNTDVSTDTDIITAIGLLRSIVDIEGKIEETWQTLQSLQRKGMDPILAYPMLRLPYKGVSTPTQDFRWFEASLYAISGQIHYLELLSRVVQPGASGASSPSSPTRHASESRNDGDHFLPLSLDGKETASHVLVPEKLFSPAAGTKSRSNPSTPGSQGRVATKGRVASKRASGMTTPKRRKSREKVSTPKSTSHTKTVGFASPKGVGAKKNQESLESEEDSHGHLNMDLTALGSVSPVRSRHNSRLRSRMPNISSRSYAGLQSYYTLSKPFHRAEARTDSQVVYIALREINNQKADGIGFLEMAAWKIQTWWKLVYPRRMLLYRMSLRQMARDIIYEVANRSAHQGESQMRKKNQFLLIGAAITIQRHFLRWRNGYLRKIILIQREFRRFRARRKFAYVLKMTRAAYRVYVFIRNFNRRHGHVQTYRLSCKRVIESFFKIVGSRVLYDQDRAMPVRFDPYAGKHGPVTSQRKRYLIYRLNVTACIRIQSAWRRKLANKVWAEMNYEKEMKKRAASSFYRVWIHMKLKRRLMKTRSTIHIQRIWRGKKVRLDLEESIRASTRIVTMWRKVKNFRSLRTDLRRIERPLNIVLQACKSIPPGLLSLTSGNSDKLKIKISVWWHPLLHIVSENDFATVIANKSPQLVHWTKPYDITPDVEIDGDSSDEEANGTRADKFAPFTPLISPLRATAGTTGESGSKRTAEKRRLTTDSYSDEPSSFFKKPLKLFDQGRKSQNRGDAETHLYRANFGGVKIQIPGCHGNSVLKFDFHNSDRKFASSVFYVGKEGNMMFWKGDYKHTVIPLQQRRGVQFQNNLVMRGVSAKSKEDTKNYPVLRFSLNAGTPSCSKAGWCRVSMRGSGPARRAAGGGIFSSLFERWHKLFMSLDGEHLSFYESKNEANDRFFRILLTDIKAVRIEQGLPTVQSFRNTRAIVEDTHNVIVSTRQSDAIYIRLSDSRAREQWSNLLFSLVKGLNAPKSSFAVPS
jgi:hypothetical protein